MSWRRRAGFGALGAAVAVGGVAAVNIAGRRLRRRNDEVLDDPLSPPTDVEHLRLATSDGGELHAVVTGAGRPVILMHGVTLQWWVWSAVIRLLRTRYQVIAWDMRGHGESRAGARGVSLEACADDLALLMESLDLRDAVIVGHSMGGMCLGRFAAVHHDLLHERVAGLVFLATSAAPASLAGLRGGMAALSGRIAVLADRGLRADRTFYQWPESNLSTIMVRGAFGPRATARMLDDVRRMLAEVSPRTVAEAVASMAAHDVRAELATVDVPAVVVVGDRDLITPPSHAKALREVVGDSQLQVLGGIGHQVMQEEPIAVVAAVDLLSARSDVATGHAALDAD